MLSYSHYILHYVKGTTIGSQEERDQQFVLRKISDQIRTCPRSAQIALLKICIGEKKSDRADEWNSNAHLHVLLEGDSSIHAHDRGVRTTIKSAVKKHGNGLVEFNERPGTDEEWQSLRYHLSQAGGRIFRSAGTQYKGRIDEEDENCDDESLGVDRERRYHKYIRSRSWIGLLGCTLRGGKMPSCLPADDSSQIDEDGDGDEHRVRSAQDGIPSSNTIQTMASRSSLTIFEEIGLSLKEIAENGKSRKRRRVDSVLLLHEDERDCKTCKPYVIHVERMILELKEGKDLDEDNISLEAKTCCKCYVLSRRTFKFRDVYKLRSYSSETLANELKSVLDNVECLY